MEAEKQTVARRPFFRGDPLVSILLLVGVFLLSQVLAAFIIGLYPNFRNFTGDQSTAWLNTIPAQFFYVLAAEALAVGMVLRLLKWAHIQRSRIGLIPPKAIHFAYAFTAYAAYFILFLIIYRLVGSALDGGQKQQLGFNAPIGHPQLLLTFASLVIFPPIAEEIMFRGFLFSSLRTRMPLVGAMFVTSLLFAIPHLGFGNGEGLLWIVAIDTFTLSCFLCYLREKTGSIWPSIVLHAIKNTVAFIALYHGYF